jgi:hypothetical protein
VGDALVVYLDWPRFHALVAVLGLAGVGAWALARRHVVTRSQALFAGGTLAIAVVTLVLLPGTPYSAGNGMTFVSGFIHWDSMRYVALLPILGWVALGVLLDAGAGPRRTAVTIAVALGALATSATTAVAAVIVLAAALLLAAVGPWLRAPAPRVSVTAAALVIAALVAWSHGAKAAATAAAFHREPLFGAAAAVLDRLPPGTRVAVFGDQWIYPAFGARHDLVPVRLDGDGAIATAPVGDAMAPGPLTVDASVFRANLARSRIDAVAVVHLPHPGRSPEWPAQAAALEAAGGTRLVHRDSAVGIWTLTR